MHAQCTTIMQPRMLALLPALVVLALGWLAGTHSSLCSNETVHEHADWTGTDILPSNKPLYTHSAAECCAACANHTTKGTAPCLFWSRFTNKQGRCYLKTTATDRHSNSAMEAGSLPGAPLPPVGPPPGPAPPGPAPPPGPPAPPQTLSVDLAGPLRPFHKPFLECVGSSHMAMGLLAENPAAGSQTAAGKGESARVGALWRDHLKLTHDALNMSMFRGHGLFDDDVGIYAGVGKPINTAPLDSLFGWAVSVGIRPVVEISYCPQALAGVCGQTTDAYKGFICAPNLNASFAEAVPLPPELNTLPAPYADYARGNLEYARMVKETVTHLIKVHGAEEIRRWKFEAWNEPYVVLSLPFRQSGCTSTIAPGGRHCLNLNCHALCV